MARMMPSGSSNFLSRRAGALLLVSALAESLLACATPPAMDARKPHHTERGFRNNHPDGLSRPSFWKWQMERWRKGLPKSPPGGWHFEVVHPDVAWIRANRTRPALTWVGHATFLIQSGGLNVLTDPHLGERASPLSFAGPRRLVPPALDFRTLPHIDAVVISHNHYDHLDEETVRRLNRQAGGPPMFLVPLGLRAWLAGRGIRNVTELDWWDVATVGPLRFTLTPVQHWSARSLWDRNETLWGGWRMDGPQGSFFFSGDTGYSPDFLEIRQRLGPVDIALLPIGAYEPRWFMGVMHVNPEEAVKVHRDLEAGHSVAMHWGTFVLTDEPMDEPPRRLAHALREAGIPHERFRVPRHGETWHLDQP